MTYNLHGKNPKMLSQELRSSFQEKVKREQADGRTETAKYVYDMRDNFKYTIEL
jgi:hypothetical protein